MKKLSITILMALQALSVGCNNSKTTANNSESQDTGSVIPDSVNQPPKISCVLKKGTVEIRQINSFTSKDTFNLDPAARVLPTDTLTIDCLATKDESPLTNLKFEVGDLSGGTTATLVGGKGTIPPHPAGSYNMSITVTDPGSKFDKVEFVNYVQCAGSIDLDLSGVGLIVNQIASSSFFNYSLSGSVSRSTPGYSNNYFYSWDFNGDGIVDNLNLTAGKIWSDMNVSTAKAYTIMANARTVRLIVRDQQCNFTVAKNFPNTLFPITRVAPTVIDFSGVPDSPDFIQADIKGLNGNSALSANLDYIARQDLNAGTEDPSGKTFKRVICDYRKKTNDPAEAATFTIRGLNRYDDGSNSNLLHGMTLSVRNILGDSGGVGPYQIVGADLNSAHYLTSEAGDSTLHDDYSKNSTCPITLQIKRAAGAVPCDPANPTGPVKGTAVLIKGLFNCPNLSTGSKAVIADPGYFACMVQTPDQCVGGGGGGGGVPPVPQ